MYGYLQTVTSKTNLEKNICWRLDRHRRKEQDPEPDPDPSVRGTEPWIRIRTKIPRNRNTALQSSDPISRILIWIHFQPISLDPDSATEANNAEFYRKICQFFPDLCIIFMYLTDDKSCRSSHDKISQNMIKKGIIELLVKVEVQFKNWIRIRIQQL